jgi:hypothetical protein
VPVFCNGQVFVAASRVGRRSCADVADQGSALWLPQDMGRVTFLFMATVRYTQNLLCTVVPLYLTLISHDLLYGAHA